MPPAPPAAALKIPKGNKAILDSLGVSYNPVRVLSYTDNRYSVKLLTDCVSGASGSST
jgi:hypothetical protein